MNTNQRIKSRNLQIVSKVLLKEEKLKHQENKFILHFFFAFLGIKNYFYFQHYSPQQKIKFCNAQIFA